MRGFSDIWTELSSILPSPLPIGDLRGMRSLEKQEPGQAVPDFPGLDRGSKYCCPVPPWLAPHSSIASRKQIFAAQEGPGGEDSSGKKKIPAGGAMKRKLLDQEWGHGGGVHSYILAMTNIANSATEGMTSSEQRHPLSGLSTKRKLQPTPFIAFILCYQICYSKKLGSGHYYRAK